nr:unnamed protein product [Digitaria exilis]
MDGCRAPPLAFATAAGDEATSLRALQGRHRSGEEEQEDEHGGEGERSGQATGREDAGDLAAGEEGTLRCSAESQLLASARRHQIKNKKHEDQGGEGREADAYRREGSGDCGRRMEIVVVAVGMCRTATPLPRAATRPPRRGCQLHGHDVFGPTTEGLLVLLDRSTYAVRVLNPFTRQVVKLPPATTLIARMTLRYLIVLVCCRCQARALLTTAPSRSILVRSERLLSSSQLMCTGQWLIVADTSCQLCLLLAASIVPPLELCADQPPRLAIAAKLTRPFARIMMDTVHLVDNDGEMMLVDRIYNANGNRKYEVYRVDLDARNMVSVRGFGGRAVFIGIEVALSISPLVFPSVRADTIYLGFDDLMLGMLDNSPINLMDGTAEPRQFEDSRAVADMALYGPLCLEEYLSWSVTGYRDTLRDTV